MSPLRSPSLVFAFARALPLGMFVGGMITANWIEAAICASALFIGYAILEASRERKS